MPQSDNIERQSDKQPNRIEKPHRIILWFLVLCGAIGTVAFLIVIALRYRKSETVPAWVTFLTASILNLLLLTVVVVQAYIYRKQLDTMGKQYDSMKKQLDTMMYGQRAYLTVSSIDFKSEGEAMATAKFELKVENSGNTPASNVEICDTGNVRDCLAIPEVLPSKSIQLGVIAPQRHAVHIIDITKDMRRLENGTISYHRHGVIRYTDIFGKPHSTKFSFELPPGISLKWYPCKEGGNEAD